eukprot:3941217-Rhodomonas_salina.2
MVMIIMMTMRRRPGDAQGCKMYSRRALPASSSWCDPEPVPAGIRTVSVPADSLTGAPTGPGDTAAK